MMINTLIAFSIIVASSATSQNQTDHARMHERGQHAMGFDQDRTIHHFRLEPDGGTIEVTAKDRTDLKSADQIRAHLRHIRAAFEQGDFTLPVFIHETEPPGATVMKERRQLMTYRFVALPIGGQVVIRTADAKAREALHDFLRFQIREHKTGDPTEVRRD
jgi:hypothetical protein